MHLLKLRTSGYLGLNHDTFGFDNTVENAVKFHDYRSAEMFLSILVMLLKLPLGSVEVKEHCDDLIINKIESVGGMQLF